MQKVLPYENTPRGHQKAVRDFFGKLSWNITVAATLHFKRCRYGYLDGKPKVKYLDSESAEEAVRQFLNRLNRQALGSAYTRHGRRLQVMAIREGGFPTTIPLHYHLQIEIPRPDLECRIVEMIHQTWAGLDWGAEAKAIAYTDEGWATYITKLRTKPNFCDAIDWVNSNVPC